MRGMYPGVKLAVSGVMLAALTACGGSSGGGNPAAMPTGNLSLALTDGPADQFRHVWVTLTGIALHTDTNQPYTGQDSSWVRLSVPKGSATVDLAALNNGALQALFANAALPAGHYRQIRFFLAATDANLKSSALATTDGQSINHILSYNNQVEYLDDALNIQEAPLEVPYPSQGMTLSGDFVVSPGAGLNLAVDVDLNHSVVPTANNGFTLRPALRAFDLGQAGAISGSFGASELCQQDSRGLPKISSSCAYGVVVKAELSDGVRHYTVRQARVDPATGNFSLYPLPVNDGSGNLLHYDLVARGRQMQTLLLLGVPASTSGSGQQAGTIIPNNELPLVIDDREYSAQFAQPEQPFTGGLADFQQTLLGSAVPYEIRSVGIDPATGLLNSAEPLPAGPVNVVSFTSATSTLPAINSVIPAEGSGSYRLGVESLPIFFDFSVQSLNPVVAPVAGGVANVAPPSPPLKASNANGVITNGSINISLGLHNTTGFDKGLLTLVHHGVVVTSLPIDTQLASVAPAIPMHRVLVGVPAGSPTANQPDAVYHAYVTVWNSAQPLFARHILPIPLVIDLRNSSSASVDATGLDVSSPASGI